jgi:hypothetical protein
MNNLITNHKMIRLYSRVISFSYELCISVLGVCERTFSIFASVVIKCIEIFVISRVRYFSFKFVILC